MMMTLYLECELKLTVAFFQILRPPHHGVTLSMPDACHSLIADQNKDTL